MQINASRLEDSVEKIDGVFNCEGSQKQPSPSLVMTLPGPGKERLDARIS